MPRLATRRRRALLAAAVALLALLLPGTVGAAWITNLVELDNGTCGPNLQIGSDRAASASATPTFFLRGDGGLSSYAMAIDGNPIGIFYSAGNAVVCVDAPTPLGDGLHLLTGTELAPHAGYVPTPYSFSVDTVAPTPPSPPVLSAYKDSGVLGDGITKYRSVNVTGTAKPNEPVQVYSNGVTVVGGARADSTGAWSVTTVTLNDGSYLLSALTLDSAGNKSVLSNRTRLTIDSVVPGTPTAPTLEDAADGAGPVVAGIAAGDAGTIRVFSDGVQIGSLPLSRMRSWRFALASLAPGPHAITVAAADAADNVSPLSAPLSVTIAAEPPPDDPAPPPPPAENEARPAPPELPRPQGLRPPPPHSS